MPLIKHLKTENMDMACHEINATNNSTHTTGSRNHVNHQNKILLSKKKAIQKFSSIPISLLRSLYTWSEFTTSTVCVNLKAIDVNRTVHTSIQCAMIIFLKF